MPRSGGGFSLLAAAILGLRRRVILGRDDLHDVVVALVGQLVARHERDVDRLGAVPDAGAPAERLPPHEQVGSVGCRVAVRARRDEEVEVGSGSQLGGTVDDVDGGAGHGVLQVDVNEGAFRPSFLEQKDNNIIANIDNNVNRRYNGNR